jgi:predicted DNA-binding transcriptional regulator YafY
MRADRLLSILLLLQKHGRLSAARLAVELEVSERTIYRDIDALSTAGIPIYGESGPDGGYSLLDNYRTHLTGLTENEVRTLFMLSIPQPLMELGVGQELKTALLKLSAALPGESLQAETFIKQRFYLDSVWWQQADEPIPHLEIIHRAVMEDKRIFITFMMPFGTEMEQLVEPYGLVAKAGVWYFVYSAHGRLQIRRVRSILDARSSEESSTRPADFDLAECWNEWCLEQEEKLLSYPVLIRAKPDFLPVLRRHFGDTIDKQAADTDRQDTGSGVMLELSFASIEDARERILSFGRGVEVLEPEALRRSVLDYAEQIVTLYMEE